MLLRIELYFAVAALILLETAAADETSNEKGKRATDSLQLIVVVSRHGNRGGYKDYFAPEPENYTEFQPETNLMFGTPLVPLDDQDEGTYPLDPYPLNDTKFWPYGLMQLTTVGRNIQYNLGRRVRTSYNGFLPQIFESKDIYACCDPVERVIMSGQLVLTGIYPPTGFQVWNKDVNWQPIPMYTNNKDHSEYLHLCPKYNTERKKLFDQFLKEEAANISHLADYVYNKTGENVTAMDLFFMYDKLLSEDNEGYTLSPWTKEIYPYPLRSHFSKLFKTLYAGNDVIVKLIVGDVLKGVFNSMNKKVDRTLKPDRKIYYFSAHDDTIMAMEVALGIPASAMPEVVHVGSALVMELHKDVDTQKHFVKVVYLDGSTPNSDPQTLPLPSCGEPCEFTNFLKSTESYTDIEYESECHKPYEAHNAFSRT